MDNRSEKMPFFDSYIFVDWSAANTVHPVNPTPNAPWVGEITQKADKTEMTYCRTRPEAVDHVFNRFVQD